MQANLKQRIITSSLLFILLLASFLNNYVFGYVLIVAGIFSLLEFFGITKIFLKKNKTLELFLNLVFITYIFIFCTIVIYLSSLYYLKILIFIILLACVASDIGGYTFGKFFKGPKLTKISPNKTIAGAFGAVFCCTLFLVFCFYYLTKNFDLNVFISGVTTSIGCQIGDLFFSYLKRKSNLKDTGNFLPGHGGILDRVDGMLIGIPIGFLTLIIIY